MSELNLISTQQPGLVAVNNFDQLKETLQAMTERYLNSLDAADTYAARSVRIRII